MPNNITEAFKPVKLDKAPIAPEDTDSVISILNSLNLF